MCVGIKRVARADTGTVIIGGKLIITNTGRRGRGNDVRQGIYISLNTDFESKDPYPNQVVPTANTSKRRIR